MGTHRSTRILSPGDQPTTTEGVPDSGPRGTVSLRGVGLVQAPAEVGVPQVEGQAVEDEEWADVTEEVPVQPPVERETGVEQGRIKTSTKGDGPMVRSRSARVRPPPALASGSVPCPRVRRTVETRLSPTGGEPGMGRAPRCPPGRVLALRCGVKHEGGPVHVVETTPEVSGPFTLLCPS